MIKLSVADLCRVAVCADRIYLDSNVTDAMNKARTAIEESKSIGAPLVAFSEYLAPVLLGETHKESTLTILRDLSLDASGGPGTIRDLFTLILLDEDFANLTSAIANYGIEHVLYALYRYGVPPTMKMLSALLDVEAEQEGWQIYMAEMSVALVRAIYGKSASDLPPYSNLIKTRHKQTDSRSADKIISDLIASRKKRKEKRKA